MSKKRILIISFSNLAFDPRVYRQINFLKDKYEIHTAGTGSSCIEAVHHVSLVPNQSAKRTKKRETAVTRTGAMEPETGSVSLAKKAKKALGFLKNRTTYRMYSGFRKILRRARKSIRTLDYEGFTVKNLKKFWKSILFLPFSNSSGVDIAPCDREALLLSKPEIVRAGSILSKERFDLIIANDLSALPFAFKVKRNAKLLYDAHEYSLDQGNSEQWKKIQLPYNRYLLDKYLSRIDGFMVTCEGSGKLYSSQFSVPDPVVVMNAPYYHDLKPSMCTGGKIRLVHHGIAGYPRRLDILIDAMKLLDTRFTLDFFLVANSTPCFEELRKSAVGDSRIRFNDPVPMQELPTVLNQFDIGIAVFPPITKNLELALPNKSFEYIQARLVVAIGPSLEMRKIVSKYDLGIVAKDFTSGALAQAIEGMNETKVMYYKERVHECAYDLSAESNLKILNKIVSDLLPA